MKLLSSLALASDEFNYPRLALLARIHSREFGSCVTEDLLDNNPQYRNALVRECTIIVAENGMKWQKINPLPGIYDFSEADKIVGFSNENGMKLRFHTLVWHKALPKWVEGALTGKAEAEKILHTYADKVLTRYKGKMRSWDIVNEPMNVWNGSADGMHRSPWYHTLGSDYIAYCFRLAHELNLGGNLVLNEYGLETADDDSAAKRKHFLNLVRNLKNKDVPVNAVGLQSHLDANKKLADLDEYQNWLLALKDTGVKILITELDVNDCALDGDDLARAHLAAAYTEEYLRRIHEVMVPDEILMWGIWDGNSVLNWSRPREQRSCQPLIYARDWQRNPLWHSIEKFLIRS